MASDEPEKFAWLNEPEARVAGPDKAAQPPPESKGSGEAPPASYHLLADLILRVLLFVSTLTAVLVMVTSKQTEYVSVPVVIPGVSVFITQVRTPAKFNYSPAFIYFVAALSVAGLYSIITSLLSFLATLKPGSATKLVFHFVILDVLMLGIVTAATGAAGAVGYIGLKGNSHSGWQKVCNTFDNYCRHIGVSLGVSLFASILLVLLVLLSVHNLSRKVPK